MEKQEIGDILERKPVEPEAQSSEAPAEQSATNRDDKGRFAPKSKQPEPETVETETGEKQTEQTPPPGAAASNAPPPGYVPVAALVDTRLEARQAKQQLAELQRQLEELRRPQAEPVDFFADPDAALNQRLAPLQQHFSQTMTSLALRASKAEAIASHGKEAVSEMENAVGEAMASGDPEVLHLRDQMLATDDPVGVAMAWYQRRKVFSEVGNDPIAYRQKLEAEIRQKVAAEMQGNAPVQRSQVMPSNIAGARNVGSRSGPMWSGPPSLNDIFRR